MNDTDIMELLSRGYLTMVGAHAGYKWAESVRDSGVDLSFTPEVPRTEPDGSVRWFDSEKQIDVQLKSTTRHRVRVDKGSLVYDLEAKAQRDVVSRLSSTKPLYLVLLVLPDDRSKWLSNNAIELALRDCAYWWRPVVGTEPTTNRSTVTIRIPLSQRVTSTFFQDRFVDCFGAIR